MSTTRLGRPFWRFLTASGLSNVADGVFQLVLPLYALHLTRSPLLISGLVIAARLPWVFLALPAGALADRADRRMLIAAADLARAVVIAALAGLVLADAARLWMLYALALALGFAETVSDTASSAVLPMVVPERDLDRANSRMFGVQVSTNYFIGPPLGGLLAAASFGMALAGSSVAYLLAALAVVGIAGRFKPERSGPPTTVRADVAEGLRYLYGHSLLRRLTLMAGGIMLTFSAVDGVLPVYAVAPGPMGLSKVGYGAFVASTAIGAVIASVVGERVIAALGQARSMRVSVVGIAVLTLSPLAVNPYLVATLWTSGAFFITIWNVIAVSTRQRIVPEHLMGRVQASFRLVAWGALPVGAALGGVLAEVIGLRATFVCAGAGTLLLLFGLRGLTDEELATPAAAAASAGEAAAELDTSDHDTSEQSVELR
jgi:MFS family permease